MPWAATAWAKLPVGIGAIWVDGAFWFETGESTRKGRNLARDPRCTVQSAVAGPDTGEPELKLYCRAAASAGEPPGAAAPCPAGTVGAD